MSDHRALLLLLLKKNLNASKPPKHQPLGGMSKDSGKNIGCRDKSSSWY